MAVCVVNGDLLEVRLSRLEKLEAVHPDVSVPLSSIRSVEVVDDALEYVHGMRMGTGIPGTTAVGTFTSGNARIFAVIHQGQHRGVRIVLRGVDIDEILLSCADADEVAARIRVAP